MIWITFLEVKFILFAGILTREFLLEFLKFSFVTTRFSKSLNAMSEHVGMCSYTTGCYNGLSELWICLIYYYL